MADKLREAAVRRFSGNPRLEQYRDTMLNVILALCPRCWPDHVLENGRVWGFCRARWLIGELFSEEEIADLIRLLPRRAKARPPARPAADRSET